MTPERFQQIKGIYRAALCRPEDARALFVSDACGGDEELRREVESLITTHEQSGDFLVKPAIEECLPIIADNTPSLVGREFGRFKILSLIAVSGMGEIYLALDTGLNRKVAVKSVYPSLTADADRVRRVWHEAQAASAIVHPNVAQIYEVLEADEHTLIVMEYVAGVTLRHRLAAGPMPADDLLRTAVQIADALAAAHVVGVVHRDIKPENVMLLEGGHVKVLDFGLAKRLELDPALAGAAGKAAMPSLFKTAKGMIVGTLPYMSPEQVRGVSTGAPTDLWSLGVIVYEMATGRAPFEGETRSDLIAAILEHTPAPLAEHAPDAPPELQRIVDKALEKDVVRRYSSAREIQADLEALRQEVLIAPKIELLRRPAEQPPPPVPEPKPPAPVIPRPGRSWPAALGAALVVLALLSAAVLVWRAFFHRPDVHFLPGRFSVRNFSESGRVSEAAVSPDGRFVVYITDEDDGRQLVWQKQVATADRIPLPQQMQGSYRGLVISPDANFIFYSLFRDAPQGELYRVSMPAATDTRRLLQDVDPPISLSPDGRRFAFIRENHDRPHELITASAEDGMPLHVMAESRLSPGGVAWSPRGDIIACSVRVEQGGRDYVSVAGFGALDGSPVTLTKHRWRSVERLAWLADMDGLLLVASDEDSLMPQVWYLSYPEGDARRITNDISEYHTLSVSRDSSLVITTALMRSARVSVAGLDGSAPAVLASGRDEGFYGVAWVPDGRIVYTSTAGGSRDLWIMNRDGSGQRQLTHGGYNNRYPTVSPDGRRVLFVSDRDGAAKIWRVNIDGTEPVPLTAGPDDSFPSVSPDGRWVVYSAKAGGRRSLFRVPLEGGEPARLTQYLANWPAVSPDGRFIACLYRDDSGTSDVKLAVVPFEGGEPLRLFDLPKGISQPPEMISAGFHWSRDGRALLYVNTADGASNIVSQPLDDAPKQLTNFRTDRIFWLDPSRSDNTLLYARGQYTHDAVLISDRADDR
jgi:serine/threonine protein kinase/Tol biopolymer transport system component